MTNYIGMVGVGFPMLQWDRTKTLHMFQPFRMAFCSLLLASSGKSSDVVTTCHALRTMFVMFLCFST